MMECYHIFQSNIVMCWAHRAYGCMRLIRLHCYVPRLTVILLLCFQVMCSYQYEERFKSFKYIDSDEDEADEHLGRR